MIRLIFIMALLSIGNAHASDCVILLHGLARTSNSMSDMAEALAASGYRVANVSYPSREHPIEELAPLAVGDGLQRCAEDAGTGKIHFVTHSLGGILVRYYYEGREPSNVGRVVMLGPPNQGSNAVDELRDVPGFDWLNGPAGFQLGKGPESVPLKLGKPRFEFAVIAGNRTIDPITSAFLDDPDDGRVSVADTKLDGMSDFVVLEVSHAFIMEDDDVIQLVRDYLSTGRFHDASSNPD
ncbi:MAG: esterase/lipase family protein [Gammaproteobacteria bacterium]